jgi:hypothetical protein
MESASRNKYLGEKNSAGNLKKKDSGNTEVNGY